MSLVESQPEESHDHVAVKVTPEACWHGERCGASSLTSQAAVVGASRSMEELAGVAGFVVEWELSDPIREQQ